VDGRSDDGTIDVINKYKDNVDIFISEPDKGVYDAMNKGIALATGDIIGILNADDFFGDQNVLSDVAAAFKDKAIEGLYGDLDYIDSKERIVRKWRSGKYAKGRFNRGWMPPHPTFYCRREVFEKLGTYSLDYGSAADYELMLRFIHLNDISVYYLNKVMVKMVIGGMSNSSLKNRLLAMQNDLKAMRKNKILIPELTILVKPLRKIRQFF
jgi:glycosyltransferase involved in cell wall biosynthesis